MKQYTIFDIDQKKERPCDYSFKRYIGQKVLDRRGIHEISEVHEFYTYYTDGTCGTPHDMHPVDPEERREALEVELEYFQKLYDRTPKWDSFRNIFKNNIKIIKKELGQQDRKEGEP